jgi:hypothetical protein
MEKPILEFKKDSEEIASSIKYLLENDDDGAVVGFSLFRFPVRFKYKNTEIFSGRWGNWIKLPVLHFAATSIDDVRKIENERIVICDLPDVGAHIKFVNTEKDIEVSMFHDRNVVNIPYCELQEGFNRFGESVKNFFRGEIPEIKKCEYWWKWINSK